MMMKLDRDGATVPGSSGVLSPGGAPASSTGGGADNSSEQKAMAAQLTPLVS
ncbi:hypothetical protein Hanom_Chr12g01114221 [Helianthus anomalus]